MKAREKARATYEDLLKVPDHMVAEILDGDLVVSPRPASRHAKVNSLMGVDLGGPFMGPPGGPRGPGGWWIIFEPELHFGDDVLVPDLAGWRRARMPEIPDVAFFTLTPDWVCEIASPRRGQVDRARKMPIYAREGIPHLWVVDPMERTLEVYGLEGGRWFVLHTFAGDEHARAVSFDAVELELGRWWL